MIKKINKHSLILSRRLRQQKELERLASYENEALKAVVASFVSAKSKRGSAEDRKAFAACEAYRSKLLSNTTEISYAIFGSNDTALVRDICKKAASSKEWCEFLYFIAKGVDAPFVLEIGTNLGISGSYIIEAIKHKKAGKFITMEGLPQLCDISSKQFSAISGGFPFHVKQGLYDQTFPEVLAEDLKFNLAFIDGNHKKEPTLEYFQQLKLKSSSPAIFIFDDINWSDEMKEAWELIKQDSDVNYLIDLYEQGIAIIDKADSNKHVGFQLHLAY